MKTQIKDHFLVIVVFLFLLIQPALTYIYNPDFFLKLPEMTWNGLRTGEYGSKLEKTLTDESFFAKVSNEQYRLMLYKFFYRLNDNVIIGKKDFLFLPENTNEIGPEEYKEKIPKLVNTIKHFKDLLDERGIPLMVAVLPNRAKVFPEYAYKNKKVPANRKAFFRKAFEALDEAGIPYWHMERDMIELRSQMGKSPYFKVDHHWTFEAVEKISPKFIINWERLHGPLTPRPQYKKVYDYEWRDIVNEYNNIVHKLGFSRGTVPVKYKEVQKDPHFRPKKFNEKTEGRLMLLSSSYGGYGLVEFLSNELGYRMPFYVIHGQPMKYSASQLIYRNLNFPEEYGKPKGVIWLMAEHNLRSDIVNDISLPEVVNIDEWRPIPFKFQDVKGGRELASDKLEQKSSNLKFKVKLPKKTNELLVNIKHDSGSQYSQSKLVFQKSSEELERFHIVHDGKRNDILLKSETGRNVWEFTIVSSRQGDKRDFEFRFFGRK